MNPKANEISEYKRKKRENPKINYKQERNRRYSQPEEGVII
jgi:hypothetical protein